MTSYAVSFDHELRADYNVVNDIVGSLTEAKSQEISRSPDKMTSIIDQLSRTKTKEEIAEQKRARAQTLDKSKSNDVAPAASSTTAEVSRAVPTTTELSGGRDPSQTTATSMTASTAPSAATSTTTATDTGTAAGVAKPKPRHPDDDRPSMRLAPKCTSTALLLVLSSVALHSHTSTLTNTYCSNTNTRAQLLAGYNARWLSLEMQW